MPDREKVIKELTEICDEAYDRWVHRPYIEDKLVTLIRDNIPDALALLREQEPVKPIVGEYGARLCGNCGEQVGAISDSTPYKIRQNYCPECGRKVKWG